MKDAEDSRLPAFGRRFFDARETFSRIGDGELGGKAAGLDRVRRSILTRLEAGEFPRLEASVPTLTVLTTEVFALFMERNRLYDVALDDLPDDRIAHAFMKASLPAEFIGDLRALIAGVRTPLAVRSSSLLEDALDHPFAGVYGTKMIPNNQADIDTRFHNLVEAIKFVYASTFFRSAKGYIRSVNQDQTAERMAVLIQEVVGRRHGDRFYPEISGVARSYNYYPSGHAAPEHGVVDLALGLGKQIVDGGLAWTYSPAYPRAPLPFNDLKDMLKNTQRDFWAINMGKPPLPDPLRETEYLLRPQLDDAEYDGSLGLLVSTYDPGSERLRPGMAGDGPRVLDFSPLLKGRELPLNDLLRRLLELTAAELGAAVEIEFAVTLADFPRRPARFGFLQARPMMVTTDEIVLPPEELASEDALVVSEHALGNGRRDDITDVVYLKPEVFAAEHTRAIAAELEQVNRALADAGRHYLLIGFGRWGSSDSWLGVPVDWGQIGNARVIVEATRPDMITDMSQGSHFFHNVISFRVLYLSVSYTSRRPIAWERLEAQETVAETRFVKHVRFPRPLAVKVDGRSGRGVVRHGS